MTTEQALENAIKVYRETIELEAEMNHPKTLQDFAINLLINHKPRRRNCQ